VLGKYPEKVKLVFKNFPLTRHKFARAAATAALAANRQGRFWEFHEELFKNYKSLSNTEILRIAEELGLDMAQFNRDIKDRAIQGLIVRDMREGQLAGVRGTPSVFINGKRLQNRSFEGFQQKIEKELKGS
jgi:protein-disulfide isomerase